MPSKAPSAIRPRTGRFGHSSTAPLLARASRRTKPFRLSEALSSRPASFSAARFTPNSRLLRLGRFSLEIIDRPQETLGAAAPLAYSEIIRLTAENTPYHAGTYMYRHLAQATRMIVIRLDDVPQGFSLATELDVEGDPFLFINATMYAPAIRGKYFTAGVNWLNFVLAVARSFPRATHIAFRTQNPLVIAAGLASGPFHPRPEVPVPPALQDAAARLSQALSPGAEFDRAVLAQRGVLARDEMDPARPRHHDERINLLVDTHLDHEAGDLFMMIARMTLWDVLKMGAKTIVRARRRRR